MPDRITAALTRRRFGGAVLLLAGIVLATIVLWPGGGRGGQTATHPAPPPRTSRLPVRIVSVPALGLAFAHPTTWTRTVEGQVFSLRSPDRSIQVIVSSPLARPAQLEAKDSAKTALLAQFSPAKVVRDGPEKLGGDQATSFELAGRDDGKPVRALVLVASTDYRTYVVTLLTGEHPSRSRLRQARQILATMQFGKPGAMQLGKPGATQP
jgi:hypothetical protein